MRNVGALFCFGLLLSAAGCTNQDFVGGEGVVAFAMTETTPPLAVGQFDSLFMVESRIELPLREPTPDEMRALRQGARDVTIPWPRLPWVARHDYDIQLDYVISNLEDTPLVATFTVNGFNEFDEYVPNVQFSSEEGAIPDFSGYERTLALEPLERRTGNVREEQMDEVAVDLATIANGVTNSNEVLHPNNQSQRDPRSMAFIPEVIPALTGFRVGLRVAGEVSEGELGDPPTIAAAPRVVAEVSVLVRDESGKIVAQSNAWTLPVPTLLYPIAPVEE
ncbi:MAG: hypothetical protein GXP55_09865 [Deltaproteobacteria bacterium]|nr:hypothetical protein [Deltaproteobacteria bacterium]